ncbi:MAG: lysylphosphatidylglycerol synthase transmembrane domain-containing protein [Lishizhenia sp.]
MTNRNPLQKLFTGKRIYFIIGLFLLISGFLVYRSLSEIHYHKSAGNGTHVWVDQNKDGQIQKNEMSLSPHGNYTVISSLDSFASINISTKTIVWFLVAIAFVVIRDLAYIKRIRVFTENQLSYKRSFITIMLWEFASALSPGVVGGSAVAMFILNKEGIGMAKSTAIVMLSTLMDNLFFVLMIPLVLCFISIETMFGPETLWLKTLFWMGYALISLLSVFLFLAIIVYPNLIGAILKRFTNLKWFKKWSDKAQKFSIDIVTTSKQLRQKELKFWLHTFGSTILSWISRYLVINALVMAFLSINIIQNIALLGKQLILWLLMLVSPTPGASGIAEFGFSELLRPFSDSLLILTCLAVLWRLISYFPYLFIGAIILPNWLKKEK